MGLRLEGDSRAVVLDGDVEIFAGLVCTDADGEALGFAVLECVGEEIRKNLLDASDIDLGESSVVWPVDADCGVALLDFRGEVPHDAVGRFAKIGPGAIERAGAVFQ